jgi:pimeloyl-ACP methyl ester carboxylesterase
MAARPPEVHMIPVPTHGITLQVETAGPDGGPPVLLLHGFPETGRLGWRRQIGPLAEAGFRVWAPDQRGYGKSDKPAGVAAYALDVLADDALGLIEATGHPAAAVVGHDWGGVVAWWLAVRHPERVRRLAILNAPHPVAFRRYILRHPRQLLRSWYAFAFQLPRLPEAGLRRRSWRGLADGLVRTSRPGAFAASDLAEYRRSWSQPGAITAMIHWYRAALRYPPRPPADPTVRVPTLILWGARDHFLQRGAAVASLALCADERIEWFEDATHWVQHEEPERVNRLFMEFLAED